MKTTYIIALTLILGMAYGLMGTSDLNEQARAERHKAETIAAARLVAHKKAQELRNAELLDDANRMMYPIAQAEFK
jgi:uncharacterized membrane protein